MSIFTKEEVEIIRRHFADGLPIKELYPKLPHHPYKRVYMRAVQLGLYTPKRELNPIRQDERQRVKEIIDAGGTWDDIFKLYPSKPAPYIYARVTRAGLKPNRRRQSHTFCTAEELAKDVEGGLSAIEIAKKYNVSEGGVRKALRRHGIKILSTNPKQCFVGVRIAAKDDFTIRKTKDIVKELQAREDELEAMLPASVANGTTAEILSKLNAVRLKIHNQQKKSDYVVNTL